MVDFTPAAPPPASTNLFELPLPPLSEAADEAVRRARAFLFGVAQGGFWMRAVLHDYTESAHRIGVFLFSIATAERSFGEWREWRALRPSRDPDLPELVEKLAAFRDRWLPRALECLAALEDEGDRDECRVYIGEDELRPSRTWTAKAFVQRIRHMERDPLFAPVWSALVARGVVEELPDFDRALGDVEAFLRAAPLTDEELADMQRGREKAASDLARWLEERERELGPALNDAELRLLGIGDMVPPRFEGVSAFLLGKIEIAAKA